jgi:hypothetical protein
MTHIMAVIRARHLPPTLLVECAGRCTHTFPIGEGYAFPVLYPGAERPPHGASAYVKTVDAETSAFRSAAFGLAHSDFPELEMKNLELASRNTWLEFRPSDFPVDVRIFMKGSSGWADLTFNRVELATLNGVVSALPKLDTNHRSGNSSCIRLTFPSFEVADGASIKTKVRAAFGRCRELIHFLPPA